MPHDVSVVAAVNKTGLLFFLRLAIFWLADTHELKAAFSEHVEVAQVDVTLHYEKFFFVVSFALVALHHFVQVEVDDALAVHVELLEGALNPLHFLQELGHNMQLRTNDASIGSLHDVA